MIHAFNFTCNRDFELSLLMLSTFGKYCPSGTISITNTDTTPAYQEYGNGSGWGASMMKLKALKDITKTKNIKDDDFVLSIDSDVVFTSSEVFSYIKPEFGIIGTKHRPEFKTIKGNWSHMSGAAIFLRGDIAKAMTRLSEDECNHVRFKHFKPFNLTENEDVVLSYLASHVGASQFDIGGIGLSSGDFESEIQNGNTKSFYHLNYCPTQFMGESVEGKWDIAKVLKMKGIQL